MLSTITPLGERAKGHSYRSTAGWFIVGGAAGGATLGAAMAGLAAGVRSLHLSPPAIGLCAVGAAVTAAVSDTGIIGARLPVHHRQVNERWLDQYRPWVYGAGFGWQIGAGLVTYITTAAVYLMIVLAALTALPVTALVIGVGFGAFRGLAVLLTRHLRTPTELRTFHRHFAARGESVGKVVIGVELGVIATLVAVVLVVSVESPAALAVLVVGLGSAGAALLVVAKRAADRPGLT
jgi:hypothetical protein